MKVRRNLWHNLPGNGLGNLSVHPRSNRLRNQPGRTAAYASGEALLNVSQSRTTPGGAQPSVDVEASAVGSGVWRPMTYAVSLTARDGRWEITALEQAPALAATDDGGER